MKIDTYKLIVVDWHDSRQPKPNWIFLDDLVNEGPVACCSVGWVVSETTENLILCPNLGDTFSSDSVQGCGMIVIPQISIKKRTLMTIPD